MEKKSKSHWIDVWSTGRIKRERRDAFAMLGNQSTELSENGENETYQKKTIRKWDVNEISKKSVLRRLTSYLFVMIIFTVEKIVNILKIRCVQCSNIFESSGSISVNSYVSNFPTQAYSICKSLLSSQITILILSPKQMQAFLAITPYRVKFSSES